MADLERLQAVFAAAERELRLARGELADAQSDDSAFASLDGHQNRVAAAVVEYAEAKRRLNEHISSNSPGEQG